MNELWWRHLALGGMSSRSALADYLHGTAHWGCTAHNLLAQTLNEALWDLGCPSLAPYRHPGKDPRQVPRRSARCGTSPPDAAAGRADRTERYVGRPRPAGVGRNRTCLPSGLSAD